MAKSTIPPLDSHPEYAAAAKKRAAIEARIGAQREQLIEAPPPEPPPEPTIEELAEAMLDGKEVSFAKARVAAVVAAKDTERLHRELAALTRAAEMQDDVLDEVTYDLARKVSKPLEQELREIADCMATAMYTIHGLSLQAEAVMNRLVKAGYTHHCVPLSRLLRVHGMVKTLTMRDVRLTGLGHGIGPVMRLMSDLVEPNHPAAQAAKLS